jgi:hypothetical protein
MTCKCGCGRAVVQTERRGRPYLFARPECYRAFYAGRSGRKERLSYDLRGGISVEQRQARIDAGIPC